ncbi:hypothetical protein [Thermoactinomyces sp. DSM 45892]|uniref:hypothetical protein n=1 Tax=Thermoactinomyces sp. DSM 45892 TaxID=1882753 RepID=UPI00089A7E38|nr:hypothetical protein [Thermoactinomyces sp. DSM 45892]SDY48254.1 hypothetical protein SAMN05444416_10557 [Thermoactinomyces sp. DSM 45892]
MLKKSILALVVSLSLLTVVTGCSFVKDQVNATAIANDMDKIVKEANNNGEFSRKVDLQLAEIEKLAPEGKITPDVSKKAQPFLDNALKEAKAFSEAMKKIEADIPKLKELAAKFTDAETKKLAEQFVADFEKSSKLDIQFGVAQEQFVEAKGKNVKSLGKDSSIDDARVKYNDLVNQSEASINEFNKSWNEFNKKVTGEQVTK